MREMRVFPEAITNNVSALTAQAGTPHSMVVVKANGYGHGALIAAHAAVDGGADWLGCADIDEALELRRGGIRTPVLSWLVGPQSDIASAIAQHVDLGVSSIDQLDRVADAAAPTQRARVHLKIDTGMGRAGVVEADWPEMFERVRYWLDQGRIEVVGVFSHMSLKDVSSDEAQGEVFARALDQLSASGIDPEIRHLASSTVAARSTTLRLDMVRLGIASYGVPVAEEHRSLNLTPAMRLSGQVILVKRLPAGHGVGYDLTYTTPKETTMALVPLGYADGIPRHASSVGPVSLKGQRFHLSGRVSMDQVTVDVGDFPVTVGEWIVFWGDPRNGEPHVSEWAEAIGTNSYELLTRIGNRVPRVIE